MKRARPSSISTWPFRQGDLPPDFRGGGLRTRRGPEVRLHSSVLVSPLSYLIGLQARRGPQVHPQGQQQVRGYYRDRPVAQEDRRVQGLKAQIIEERYVSALTKQSSGVYKYQSVKKEIPVSTTDLTLSDKGTKFRLPTANPGDFLLIVQDEKEHGTEPRGLQRCRQGEPDPEPGEERRAPDQAEQDRLCAGRGDRAPDHGRRIPARA